MAKKSLLQERIVYKPFEYPEAHDYWMKQQQAHWLHTEVPMMREDRDWETIRSCNKDFFAILKIN